MAARKKWIAGSLEPTGALVIDAGAELETKNGSGVTPLFNAAFFCHTDVLESLLETLLGFGVRQ